MKVLKISLMLAAIMLFVFACRQTAKNNSNSTPNTNVVAANSYKDNTTAVSDVNSAANDESAAARKIYSEQCINCHKEGGVGGVSTIEGKQIKAPNFTSERMKKDDENDWIETIHNGAKEDGMPAYKNRLTDDQIKSLVRLIRRDFQGMP